MRQQHTASPPTAHTQYCTATILYQVTQQAIRFNNNATIMIQPGTGHAFRIMLIYLSRSLSIISSYRAYHCWSAPVAMFSTIGRYAQTHIARRPRRLYGVITRQSRCATAQVRIQQQAAQLLPAYATGYTAFGAGYSQPYVTTIRSRCAPRRYRSNTIAAAQQLRHISSGVIQYNQRSSLQRCNSQ